MIIRICQQIICVIVKLCYKILVYMMYYCYNLIKKKGDELMGEMGIHYQGIRTEEDFRKWATYYNDPKDVHVEFSDKFMYIYRKGVWRDQFNLMVFSKSKFTSICEELGIEIREF